MRVSPLSQCSVFWREHRPSRVMTMRAEFSRLTVLQRTLRRQAQEFLVRKRSATGMTPGRSQLSRIVNGAPPLAWTARANPPRGFCPRCRSNGDGFLARVPPKWTNFKPAPTSPAFSPSTCVALLRCTGYRPSRRSTGQRPDLLFPGWGDQGLSPHSSRSLNASRGSMLTLEFCGRFPRRARPIG